MNQTESKTLYQVQFLKFCAFIFIFLYHARGYLSSEYFNGLGTFGVSFFILCSGFTTGWSRIPHESKACNIKNLWGELKRKIIKFYPLYFGTVLFGIILTDIPKYISLHYYEGLAEPCAQLVRTLLMIQSWFNNGSYFMFNPVCWFISTMLLLYLLNIPMMNIIRIYKDNLKSLSFMALGCFIVILAYSFFVGKLTSDIYWTYIFPPARIGEYFLGMILGSTVRLRKEHFLTSNNISLLKGTILEIAAILLWVGPTFVHAPSWAAVSAFWVIPNALLLIIFSFGTGYLTRLFNLNIFKKLGQISMECFFIHFLIISACSWLLGLSTVSKLGNLFMVAYDFALTIVFGFLLHKSAEK